MRKNDIEAILREELESESETVEGIIGKLINAIDEHKINLHDVDKTEILLLIERILSLKSNTQSGIPKQRAVEWGHQLANILTKVNLICSTYHNEFKNTQIKRALVPFTKQCYETESLFEKKRDAFGNKHIDLTVDNSGRASWNRFVMMHSTRQMLESKCQAGSLQFKTYMQLLGADYSGMIVEKPYYFVSSEFNKFIKKNLESKTAVETVTYRDLQLLQRAIERQSISFPESSQFYQSLINLGY